MAYGIEVWRSDGKKQISITGRQAKVHSVYQFWVPAASPPTTITQYVTGMLDNGNWAAVVSSIGVGAYIFNGYFQVIGNDLYNYTTTVTILQL